MVISAPLSSRRGFWMAIAFCCGVEEKQRACEGDAFIDGIDDLIGRHREGWKEGARKSSRSGDGCVWIARYWSDEEVGRR